MSAAAGLSAYLASASSAVLALAEELAAANPVPASMAADVAAVTLAVIRSRETA